MEGPTYIGTELKYAITITSPGFDMGKDNFEVTLKRGSKSLHFTKDDLVVDEDGQYYVCFDSADLGTGMVAAVITAYVPDDDFPDGLRTEVYKMDLVIIKNV